MQQAQQSGQLGLPQRLHSLAAMAALLERLDRLAGDASAAQYQEVARRVGQLLEAAEPDAYLDRLLALAPATAELYENRHYAEAGLCRSPLDAAAAAELEARRLIGRLRG
ncbi:hypothetical protein G8A07_22405 [Roseateles sp. DAIF2]|uniref:hypothetical protein n=1 Tax=Roseateles sp. DAIF2 TaxID=2714952 RepID=UPI0018C02C01|nr:hypothetical protein [Roseateles sp. DAIF2]QPF75400.1 hypothetical protein G8A07_22405 [Roseateles sp. DAIF2]